jgi:O-antigen/teichoic acid export membrane protein
MKVFDETNRPLFFKIVVAPVQFGSSLFAWKYFFSVLDSRSIIVVGALLSFQFISVVSLLGTHVSIGNEIIDGKGIAKRTLIHSFFTSSIFFAFVFIALEISRYSIFQQIGMGDINRRLIFLTLFYFLAVSPLALVQSVLVVSGSANSVNISAAISGIFLFLVILILQVKNIVINIEGVIVVLLLAQFSGLVYLFYVLAKFTIQKSSSVNYRDLFANFNFGALLISILAPLASQMDRYLVAKYGSIQQSLDINALNQLLIPMFPILSWVGTLFWKGARSRPSFGTLINHLKIMLFVLVFFITFILFILSRFMKLILPVASNVSLELKFVLVVYIVFYGLFVIFGAYLSSVRGQLFLASCSGIFFVLQVQLSPFWLGTPDIVRYYSGLVVIQFFVLLLPTIIYTLMLIRSSAHALDLEKI